MINRFLLWTILLLIAGGVILYYHVDLPTWLRWIGSLPGDMWIKKDGIYLYFPLTSAMVVSFVVALLLSIFSRKKK
jgi:hypothetical protein